MKILSVLTLSLLSSVAMSSEYFVEARAGVSDEYSKKVQNSVSGKLEGDFKGTNFGLRAGKYIDKHSIHLEYNPSQEVEVKSANEAADVESIFLGYRYNFDNGIYTGAQVGKQSFELKKGPNGVTFPDNPKASGITYGVNVGYKYKFTDIYYVGADFSYNFGSYKDKGPSSTSVTSIEIESSQQLNLVIGIAF